MKSIRSELSSLSVWGSRAVSRGRLIRGTEGGETGLGSPLCSLDKRFMAAVLIPVGPVARMNTAKSATDSRDILGSLACGGCARGGCGIACRIGPDVVGLLLLLRFNSGMGCCEWASLSFLASFLRLDDDDRDRSESRRRSWLFLGLTAVLGLPVDRVD